MLILGLILLIAGLITAALLNHQIGSIIAVIGLILLVIWLILLIADTNDAHAALMLPFGPHLARLLRRIAGKLDPTWTNPRRITVEYPDLTNYDGWHTATPTNSSGTSARITWGR